MWEIESIHPGESYGENSEPSQVLFCTDMYWEISGYILVCVHGGDPLRGERRRWRRKYFFMDE